MDDARLDFEQVLKLALERCEDRPPCLVCLSGAAAKVILDWLEMRSHSLAGEWPLEEDVAV